MRVTLFMILVPTFASAQTPLEDYPRLDIGVQAHYVSSYDRSGGNDDGFDGTYSALYVDERGEHVLVDAKGPGTLYNLWFTSRVNGRSPLGTGRIRFYFDDESAARIDMDVDTLYSGRHPPFVRPFVYDAFQSTGGYVTYLPLPFHKRLKITTERRVGFYNAYYHTYAPDRGVATWTGEEDTRALERSWTRLGEDPKPWGGLDIREGRIEMSAPDMPDGEPVPSRQDLLAYQGAGAIASLRFDPLFPLTPYQLNHVLLNVYWDGEEKPSVSAPLGSFFGSGLGEASVRAMPLGMSSSGPYYCYLPMPFWKSFRVELVNENPEAIPEIWWEIGISDETYPEESSGHFEAVYRREWPTTAGEDYRILETEGRGRYVGQVMTVEPLRSEIKRWWEGDLRIYLDGQRQPSFHGTGHEDEYLGGWSNEWLMNPYSLPMHGEPKTAGLKQVDFQWSAATTVYRFFVSGVPFQNGIRVSTEHGASNSANAMYSSVAYYYESPRAIEKLDEQSAHGLRFTLRVPRGATSLRLRKLYNRSEIQDAEVWVNGQRAGVWYEAQTNAHHPLAESDFLLPEALRTDREELEVELREVRSGWNAERYELWGMK